MLTGAMMLFDKTDNSERADNFRLIERKRIEVETDLGCKDTRTLFRWWHSFSPSFPSRTDFDITAVPSIASNIYLIEVIAPGKYLYRLCGQTVGDLVGRSLRMADISLESPKFEDRKLAEYLDELVENDSSCCCSGDLSFFDKKFLKFESFDCPLKDEDGTITHFVGVLCEAPK